MSDDAPQDAYTQLALDAFQQLSRKVAEDEPIEGPLRYLRALADPILEAHPDLKGRWTQAGAVFDETDLSDPRTREQLQVLVHAYHEAGILDGDDLDL